MAELINDFKKFPELTGKTINELDKTKQELEERGNQIRELATQSNIKFTELIKANTGLKEKIEFLQSLATTLSIRNEELEKKNLELEKQKTENSMLANDLKRNLEQVLLKEKELEIHRDQLERKITQKTEELMRSEKLAIIGELASRMAHDLRNPLSTIKNVVELMESKQKLKIEEKIIYYSKLHRAIDRISHQVDDVLEYGKSTQLNLQTCIVANVIRQVVADNNLTKNIAVNIENSDVKVNMDLQKMEAVFTNLLVNAAQAIEGIGTIDVRIIDDGANVLIVVEDSGPGILEEHLPKIFEPLFTTKQTGTGLGLSICKKIIEQHGGNITVKNNPTTFIIRLPRNF